jgi:hypothetical protein
LPAIEKDLPMELSRDNASESRAVDTRSDPVVADFIGVMGQLTALMEEENAFLSRGMPATLLVSTQRKGALSAEYGMLSAELTSGTVKSQLISDPRLQEMLVESGAMLCALSEENRQLLENALSATRRRVDAVMEAVRAHDHAASRDRPTSGSD